MTIARMPYVNTTELTNRSLQSDREYGYVRIVR
jgi:hypothetical protein